MKKFENIILCSDIDGTLTNDKGAISKENLDAIEYFTKNGGRFIISSGRFYHYAETTLGYKPCGAVIGLNGAHIYDYATGKDVFTAEFDDEAKNAVTAIFESANGEEVSVYVHNKDSLVCCKTAEELKDALVSVRPCVKVVFKAEPETADRLCDYAVKNFSHAAKTVKSCPVLTEVLPLGAGKDVCVEKLREYYGGDVTVVAVGDYSNDIEMIRKADIGYAVENALPEVKAVADRYAPHHTKHAIAFIVKELEDL